MRGLLACAKWELLWQWRQFRSGEKWVLVQVICLPIYSFAMSGNVDARWNVLLGSGLVPVVVVQLLSIRAFQWLFGGTLALERTSGRAEWQSVLGRCLVWLPELCGAELFRQLVVWASIERDTDIMTAKRDMGAFVFDAAEAGGLLGPEAFLSALCVTFGVCTAALTAALLSRSGKRRHRVKLTAGYGSLLAAGVVIWGVWYLTRIPPEVLGAVSVAGGLPLSCHLLEYWVE